MAQQDGSQNSDPIGEARQRARGLASSVADITVELQTLGKMEVDLARAEMAEAGRHATRGTGMALGALLMGQIAAVFVFLTLMFGLDEWLQTWLAALITALIVLALTALLAFMAMRQIRAVSPVPQRFVQSLREDMAWAKSLTSSRMT